MEGKKAHKSSANAGRPASHKAMEVLTIGHSTRPIETFIRLLKAHAVEALVDVRTIPRSRFNPQFNQETLAEALHAQGIDYRHMKALGGMRHARKDSPNLGWRNGGFRGYADYMQTEEFERALEALIALSQSQRLALMCAEAVPWRCHRSLLADALTVRGIAARHIMSEERADPHRLTAFAHVEGNAITYPPSQLSLV
jgi:uncharacterized protein (DUF488 family)